MRLHDRIYGEVEFPDLCALISSHIIFRRLDGISQLGACSLVYPSATHSRREHSIGVSVLAGEVGHRLQTLYEDRVDVDDILCLQVAGLVHDLGHGPFSHAFEHYTQSCNVNWSHESAGCELFLKIVKDIDVTRHFETNATENIMFICLLLEGLSSDDAWPETVGRDESKRFLTEIVHNRTCGVDVDKLDYLVRDGLAVLGASRALEVKRIVNSIRVIGNSLCFDHHITPDLVEVFMLRTRMHIQVYQHHSVALAGLLVNNLMRCIDKHDTSTFCSKACNPFELSKLTDASVLSHPLIQTINEVSVAYRKVLNCNGMKRLSRKILLPTLPKCVGCGSETEILDAFCKHCGRETRDRLGVQHPSGGLVVPNSLVTEDQASVYVGSWVVILDVKCGQAVTTEDPYGRVWRDYDPLRNIRLVSPKDQYVSCEGLRGMLPLARHVRIARCYAERNEEEVEAAFVKRGDLMGGVEID